MVSYSLPASTSILAEVGYGGGYQGIKPDPLRSPPRYMSLHIRDCLYDAIDAGPVWAGVANSARYFPAVSPSFWSADHRTPPTYPTLEIRSTRRKDPHLSPGDLQETPIEMNQEVRSW